MFERSPFNGQFCEHFTFKVLCYTVCIQYIVAKECTPYFTVSLSNFQRDRLKGSDVITCSYLYVFAVKTHLNCASLLHEYALRFRRSCRDLVLVESLKKVSTSFDCIISWFHVYNNLYCTQVGIRRSQTKNREEEVVISGILQCSYDCSRHPTYE